MYNLNPSYYMLDQISPPVRDLILIINRLLVEWLIESSDHAAHMMWGCKYNPIPINLIQAAKNGIMNPATVHLFLNDSHTTCATLTFRHVALSGLYIFFPNK